MRRAVTAIDLIAIGAVAVALCGTAVAATKLPDRLVGSAQLKTHAVEHRNLATGSVTASDVKPRSLLAKDFRAGQLQAGPRGQKGDRGPAGPGAVGVAVSDAQKDSADVPTATVPGTGLQLQASCAGDVALVTVADPGGVTYLVHGTADAAVDQDYDASYSYVDPADPSDTVEPDLATGHDLVGYLTNGMSSIRAGETAGSGRSSFVQFTVTVLVSKHVLSITGFVLSRDGSECEAVAQAIP